MHPPETKAEVVPFFRILFQDKTRRVGMYHRDLVILLDEDFMTVTPEYCDHTGFSEKAEEILTQMDREHARSQAWHIRMQRMVSDDEYGCFGFFIIFQGFSQPGILFFILDANVTFEGFHPPVIATAFGQVQRGIDAYEGMPFVCEVEVIVTEEFSVQFKTIHCRSLISPGWIVIVIAWHGMAGDFKLSKDITVGSKTGFAGSLYKITAYDDEIWIKGVDLLNGHFESLDGSFDLEEGVIRTNADLRIAHLDEGEFLGWIRTSEEGQRNSACQP